MVLSQLCTGSQLPCVPKHPWLIVHEIPFKDNGFTMRLFPQYGQVKLTLSCPLPIDMFRRMVDAP